MSKITYTNEVVDAYSGQLNCEAGIYIDGDIVGVVEYVLYEKELTVSDIFIRPEFRRKGYASRLMKYIQQENPNYIYRPSLKTPEGAAFVHKNLSLTENKAQYVNFERGKDPKKSLKIGKYKDYYGMSPDELARIIIKEVDNHVSPQFEILFQLIKEKGYEGIEEYEASIWDEEEMDRIPEKEDKEIEEFIKDIFKKAEEFVEKKYPIKKPYRGPEYQTPIQSVAGEIVGAQIDGAPYGSMVHQIASNIDTSLLESVNFERGQDPKEAMGLGMVEKIKRELREEDVMGMWDSNDLEEILIWSITNAKRDYVKFLLGQGVSPHSNDAMALKRAVTGGDLNIFQDVLNSSKWSPEEIVWAESNAQHKLTTYPGDPQRLKILDRILNYKNIDEAIEFQRDQEPLDAIGIGRRHMRDMGPLSQRKSHVLQKKGQPIEFSRGYLMWKLLKFIETKNIKGESVGYADCVRYYYHQFKGETWRRSFSMGQRTNLNQYVNKDKDHKYTLNNSGKRYLEKYRFFDDKRETIKEALEFERGKDPKQSIGLGVKEQIRREINQEWYPDRYGADQWDGNYNTALTWAAEKGRLDYIKWLINQGADIRNNDNEPIKQAASFGQKDVVVYLIDHGADPLAGNGYPILAAKFAGYPALAELIKLKAGEIKESLEFERGRDPKETMDIGISRKLKERIFTIGSPYFSKTQTRLRIRELFGGIPYDQIYYLDEDHKALAKRPTKLIKIMESSTPIQVKEGFNNLKLWTTPKGKLLSASEGWGATLYGDKEMALYYLSQKT